MKETKLRRNQRILSLNNVFTIRRLLHKIYPENEASICSKNEAVKRITNQLARTGAIYKQR